MPSINVRKGTKAEILSLFQKKLKLSIIEKLYYFSVDDWQKKPASILHDIQKSFHQDTIVVRSSSVLEDQDSQSNAGRFTSILNVNAVNEQSVRQAIAEVIESFQKGHDTSVNSQILVQKQCKNSVCSGVVFTRNPQNGAPYYLINYDDSTGITSAVASGEKHQQILVYKLVRTMGQAKRWKTLLRSIREIESLAGTTPLDIEFAITKNGTVHIFQVRKLHVNGNDTFSSYKLTKALKKAQAKHKNGLTLSNMAFWNPAEIVGEKPKPLAASLYNFIILKRSWNTGIVRIGYTDTHAPIYHTVLGRTYINARVAFSSLLPNTISSELNRRLVAVYIKRLRQDPRLHDKIEFQIVPNCFNFSLDHEFEREDYKKFTVEEVATVKTAIVNQTKTILRTWKKFIEDAELVCERDIITLDTSVDTLTTKEKFNKALLIFRECSRIDIPNFAAAARLAFISKSILLSLVPENILTQEESDELFSRVKTYVPTFEKKEKSQLNNRGHLRAGTYDITQLPYAKNTVITEKNITTLSQHAPVPTEIVRKLGAAASNYGLHISGEKLIEFLLTAQSKREYFKFLFTKQISFALELIADAGSELGLSREQLAYLTYSDLEKSMALQESQLKHYLERKIKKRFAKYQRNSLLSLPDCIFSKADYEIVSVMNNRPNFVTTKKITAEIVQLTSSTTIIERKFIENKIVVVESADPGFDWIFEQNIAGLVTKFGGAGSHMAIRCNEYQVPAALGCGERLFSQVIASKQMTLDCENGKIFTYSP